MKVKKNRRGKDTDTEQEARLGSFIFSFILLVHEL